MTQENTGEQGGEAAVDIPENDYVLFSEAEKVEEPVKELEPVEAEPEEQEEDPEEDTGSEEVKPKKRNNGWKQKIAKLRDENARLAAELANKADGAPAKANAEGKPLLENYQSYDDYIDALTDYKAEQAADRKLKARDEAVKQTEVVKTWEAKKDEARKLYKDFDEVLSEYDDLPVRKDIIDAMVESEVGGDLAYYLANNPDELEAINRPNISAFKINKELARIEASILGKKSGSAAVKTTKAPPPITPVTKKSKAGVFDPSTASMEEYRAWRERR